MGPDRGGSHLAPIRGSLLAPASTVRPRTLGERGPGGGPAEVASSAPSVPGPAVAARGPSVPGVDCPGPEAPPLGRRDSSAHRPRLPLHATTAARPSSAPGLVRTKRELRGPGAAGKVSSGTLQKSSCPRAAPGPGRLRAAGGAPSETWTLHLQFPDCWRRGRCGRHVGRGVRTRSSG